jgi:hypoxanthine phosphoribosyltransferase
VVFPHSQDNKKKILLVDDINDTGATFVNIMRNMLNDGVNLDDVTLCALYQKNTSDIEVDVYGFIAGDDWLVFPWEYPEPELPTQDENQTVYYWCFNFDKPAE